MRDVSLQVSFISLGHENKFSYTLILYRSSKIKSLKILNINASIEPTYGRSCSLLPFNRTFNCISSRNHDAKYVAL